MSGDVFVVPAISSGLQQIQLIMEFTSFLMKSEDDKQSLLDNHFEKNPECLFDIEEFVKSKIDDILGGFSSLGVSIGNATAFPKGSNVKKVEVERSLLHVKSLEQSNVGIFSRLAPSLKATQVAEVVKRFSGTVKSYISNRRDINKLLFQKCFSSDSRNALFNPFRVSVMAEINQHMLYIDPVDVLLCVEMEDGVIKDVELLKNGVKPDLSLFSRTKENGTKYLDIKRVKICTKRTNNRNSTFADFWNRPFEYNLANESALNPLLNPDAVVYNAGFVSVRKVGSEYALDIPITAHLTITAPKTDSRYEISTVTYRIAKSVVPLLHRPARGKAVNIAPLPTFSDNSILFSSQSPITPLPSHSTSKRVAVEDDMNIDDQSNAGNGNERMDWSPSRAEQAEAQREGCEKRSGAVDWHLKYEQYRALIDPKVCVAELYVA
jgi:hypothetical protein